MLSARPLPADLAARLDALCQAWSGDSDLAAIYLFGSRAGGRGGPRSDVDLAVVLREELDADARWRKRLALLSDACQRLGTDAVDLVILEALRRHSGTGCSRGAACCTIHCRNDARK